MLSNKKFKKNIDLEEIKSINLKENNNNEEKEINLDKEVEDIVDNIITNVVVINQKKVSFDDNWIEINPTDEDHNEGIL